MKKFVLGGIAAIAITGLTAGCGSSGHPSSSGSSQPPFNIVTTPPAAAANYTPPAPSSAAPAAPTYTVAQQQAIDAAESYLSDEPGWSRAGLIGQLDSSAGGFTQALATFAVNHIPGGVNWDQQAVLSAKSYMSEEPGWSFDGLVQQLDSSAVGFTYAQAVYGVKGAGL